MEITRIITITSNGRVMLTKLFVIAQLSQLGPVGLERGVHKLAPLAKPRKLHGDFEQDGGAGTDPAGRNCVDNLVDVHGHPLPSCIVLLAR